MFNAKKFINTILNDQRLTNMVEAVMDFYPDSIEKFPCVIFQEDGQNDVEFADNKPLADHISILIHIYTKTLKTYSTTSEIGAIVDVIMKENYFVCMNNYEAPDTEDKVRHRVLRYTREVFS